MMLRYSFTTPVGLVGLLGLLLGTPLQAGESAPQAALIELSSGTMVTAQVIQVTSRGIVVRREFGRVPYTWEQLSPATQARYRSQPAAEAAPTAATPAADGQPVDSRPVADGENTNVLARLYLFDSNVRDAARIGYLKSDGQFTITGAPGAREERIPVGEVARVEFLSDVKARVRIAGKGEVEHRLVGIKTDFLVVRGEEGRTRNIPLRTVEGFGPLSTADMRKGEEHAP